VDILANRQWGGEDKRTAKNTQVGRGASIILRYSRHVTMMDLLGTSNGESKEESGGRQQGGGEVT